MLTITNIDSNLTRSELVNKKYVIIDLKNMDYKPKNNYLLTYLIINKYLLMDKTIIICKNNVNDNIIEYLMNTQLFKLNNNGLTYKNNCLNNFILLNIPEYTKYDELYKENYQFIIEMFRKYYKNVIITYTTFNNSIINEIDNNYNEPWHTKRDLDDSYINSLKDIIFTYNIKKIIELHNFDCKNMDIIDDENYEQNVDKNTNKNQNNHQICQLNYNNKNVLEQNENVLYNDNISDISNNNEEISHHDDYDCNYEFNDQENDCNMLPINGKFNDIFYILNGKLKNVDISINVHYNLQNEIKDIDVLYIEFRSFYNTYNGLIEHTIKKIVDDIKY